MKKERFGVWVREMDVLPKGYGVAWCSPYSSYAFCMRVPFNRIVGAFRAWYLDWRRPVEGDPIMTAFTYGKNLGFKEGHDHGYEIGMRHAVIAFKAGYTVQ